MADYVVVQLELVSAEEALHLLKKAGSSLSDTGIYQWDEVYSDIEKGNAFGCFIDDQLTAYVCLNQVNDEQYAEVEFQNPAASALTIHRLAVLPEYQGRGIASAIISFAETYAAKNNYRSIRLDAFSRNPGALRLYEDRGYIQRGIVSLRGGLFHLFEKQLPGIEFRAMRPEDSGETKNLARKSFPFFYRLFIRNFNNGEVAVENGKIIGAAVWHRFNAGGKIFGFLDFGFTDSGHRGRGIGRNAYRLALERMEAKHSEYLGALVLCDNTASWKLLEDCGCRRVGYIETAREFGIAGALKIWFNSAYAFAPGADLWIKGMKKMKRREASIAETVRNIAVFIILNAVIALVQGLYLSGRPDFETAGLVAAFCALKLLSSGTFIIGSGMRFRFHFWKSGMLLPLIIFFGGGIYPLGGGYYPAAERWNYHENRLRLGLIGLGGWMASILAGAAWLAAAYYLPDSITLPSHFPKWIFISLIFNCCPFVMESWPGARVVKWNRKVFAVLFLISLLLIVLFIL